MKNMNTTIQIRISKLVKEKARRKFADIGLDLSSGIKSFLSEVARSNEPLKGLRTANGFTVEYERRIRKESDYALRHGKSYRNAEELHAAILGKDNIK